MWTCPKCQRTFKRNNQPHYCGEKPKTIAEYIGRQNEAIQPYLNAVHNALKEALPEVEEQIKWAMPTYYQDGIIVNFAANKEYFSLYVGSEVVNHFAARLTAYATSKGTIKFPYQEPLPLDLIKELAIYSLENK